MADTGEAERGGRLEGAAGSFGVTRPVADTPADAREVPGDARAAGREMTVDEAVVYALVAAG